MTALITGASGGLGRAMATECAARGCDLFLTDVSEENLKQIKQGIIRQYDVAVYQKACDLTDESAVKELFHYIKEEKIRLTMLLNIAGIDFEGGFLDRESDKITDIIQLNVEATLRVTHAALKNRDEKERFYILIVSSLASQYPIPLKATYAASKRFLLDFSIALRQELKNKNVRVLALCPGGLPTTKEAQSGIAAQGIWGSLTTNSLPAVANKTVSKMISGKSVYIPGFINSSLCFAGKIVPRTLIASLLYKRWNSAQNKWLTNDKQMKLL